MGDLTIGTEQVPQSDVISASVVPTASNATSTLVFGIDRSITVDSTSGDVTKTLPDPTANPGGVMEMYRINAAGNIVRYKADVGHTIEGEEFYNLAKAGQSVKLISDGTATWRVSVRNEEDVIPLGELWTTSVNPEDNTWTGVAFGNGVYVAVASSGTLTRVMTSSDGVNWTTQTNSDDRTWQSVVFAKGLFVAVAAGGGTNQVMTSPDGITWTTRTTPTINVWSAITYGNNIFVAVSQTGTLDRVMTSLDGITWEVQTTPNNNGWRNVTFGNGLFVAIATSVGVGNRVMTSPDGVTWTARTTPEDNSWSGITYAKGLFVAVAGSGSGNRVMTSVDGITWIIGVSAADDNWSAVTYGNGVFIAVGNPQVSTGIMTSVDGFAWESQVSAASNSWSNIIFANGLAVAIASSAGAGDRVMISGILDSVELNEVGVTTVIAVSANYTVAPLIEAIDVTAGATDKAINLPVLADYLGREITVCLADNLAGNAVATADGSDLINGAATNSLTSQYESKTYKAFLSEWRVI